MMIRSDSTRTLHIVCLKPRNEQDNRNMLQFRIVLDVGADIIPVLSRNRHVGHDQSRTHVLEASDRLLAIVHGHDLDAFIGKGQGDYLLNCYTVIDQ